MGKRCLMVKVFVGCVLCCAATAPAAVVKKSVGDLTAQSQQIVIGDVVEITSFWDANHELINSRIVVSVSDYLLGNGSGTEVMVMAGGTVDGLTLRVSVLPIFQLGDRALLFLGNNEIRLVESFQGAFLTDGEQVVQMAPSCGRIFEETLQPLADLLAEIQQALPPGAILNPPQPYTGGFQIPLGGPRYALCNQDWTYMANPMGEDFVINANCADASAGDANSQRTQILNGTDAWNNAGADFQFTYGGTSGATSVTFNGVNLVYFDTTPPSGGGYLAATFIWGGANITECDLVFNDTYTWWDGSGWCGNKYDIWSVATHEFGHYLCLDHSSNNQATMYYAVGTCQTFMRTLHSDDINGILAIYGAGVADGACCFGDGSCTVETAANCNSSGGTYWGDGTTCSPNPCPQPTGACCYSDDSCSEETQSACGSSGGTYEGDGTTCTPNPCCVLAGDMNGDGAVAGDDVAGYVRVKLGTPDPGDHEACANYGGTLDQDNAAFIADLLN